MVALFLLCSNVNGENEPRDQNSLTTLEPATGSRNKSITKEISKSYENMYLKVCLAEIFDRLKKSSDECSKELQMVSGFNLIA